MYYMDKKFRKTYLFDLLVLEAQISREILHYLNRRRIRILQNDLFYFAHFLSNPIVYRTKKRRIKRFWTSNYIYLTRILNKYIGRYERYGKCLKVLANKSLNYCNSSQSPPSRSASLSSSNSHLLLANDYLPLYIIISILKIRLRLLMIIVTVCKMENFIRKTELYKILLTSWYAFKSNGCTSAVQCDEFIDGKNGDTKSVSITAEMVSENDIIHHYAENCIFSMYEKYPVNGSENHYSGTDKVIGDNEHNSYEYRHKQSTFLVVCNLFKEILSDLNEYMKLKDILKMKDINPDFLMLWQHNYEPSSIMGSMGRNSNNFYVYEKSQINRNLNKMGQNNSSFCFWKPVSNYVKILWAIYEVVRNYVKLQRSNNSYNMNIEDILKILKIDQNEKLFLKIKVLLLELYKVMELRSVQDHLVLSARYKHICSFFNKRLLRQEGFDILKTACVKTLEMIPDPFFHSLFGVDFMNLEVPKFRNLLRLYETRRKYNQDESLLVEMKSIQDNMSFVFSEAAEVNAVDDSCFLASQELPGLASSTLVVYKKQHDSLQITDKDDPFLNSLKFMMESDIVKLNATSYKQSKIAYDVLRDPNWHEGPNNIRVDGIGWLAIEAFLKIGRHYIERKKYMETYVGNNSFTIGDGNTPINSDCYNDDNNICSNDLDNNYINCVSRMNIVDKCLSNDDSSSCTSNRLYKKHSRNNSKKQMSNTWDYEEDYCLLMNGIKKVKMEQYEELSPSLISKDKEFQLDKVSGSECSSTRSLLTCRRKKWTKEETQSLVELVNAYGVGVWETIRCKNRKISDFSGLQLKDKWRNLHKFKKVIFDTNLNIWRLNDI